jgi:hypothetical protein
MNLSSYLSPRVTELTGYKIKPHKLITPHIKYEVLKAMNINTTSCLILPSVVWKTRTNVSKQPSTSIFGVQLSLFSNFKKELLGIHKICRENVTNIHERINYWYVQKLHLYIIRLHT